MTAASPPPPPIPSLLAPSLLHGAWRSIPPRLEELYLDKHGCHNSPTALRLIDGAKNKTAKKKISPGADGSARANVFKLLPSLIKRIRPCNVFFLLFFLSLRASSSDVISTAFHLPLSSPPLHSVSLTLVSDVTGRARRRED